MGPLVEMIFGAALGASVLVLALAVLTAILVRCARLGRLRVRGELRMPGASCAGELVATSKK